MELVVDRGLGLVRLLLHDWMSERAEIVTSVTIDLSIAYRRNRDRACHFHRVNRAESAARVFSFLRAHDPA